VKKEQINELLYQALETERGGIQVYEAAIGGRSGQAGQGQDAVTDRGGSNLGRRFW
jgi:hypothetical protein